MVFYLISSDYRNAITLSIFNAVGLLPIVTTRLSHEFGNEYIRIMELSYL
jgi:hypothetical protein